jgi:aminoglycoside phosphotransferase (APT) family kinase protein
VPNPYAELPTAEQLRALAQELGGPVDHESRIVGGLGGTIDVLLLGATDHRRVVLKRYWLPEPGEVNPAESEFRALTLAAEHGITAPSPLWIDTTGLFLERAIVTSFLDGRPLLDPSDPLDWATQLAGALSAIHRIRTGPDDADLFPVLGNDDGHGSETEKFEAVQQHPLGPGLWSKRAQSSEEFEPVTPTYLHHDYWPGNTLWVGGRLVAVVDWEGGALGDPALDVAYCAFDIRLLGLDAAADHFVAEYRRLTGRQLENLRHWELSALCRPMPDVAIWLPGWTSMGVAISAEEARLRHTALIARVLSESE